MPRWPHLTKAKFELQWKNVWKTVLYYCELLSCAWFILQLYIFLYLHVTLWCYYLVFCQLCRRMGQTGRNTHTDNYSTALCLPKTLYVMQWLHDKYRSSYSVCGWLCSPSERQACIDLRRELRETLIIMIQSCRRDWKIHGMNLVSFFSDLYLLAHRVLLWNLLFNIW